MKVYILMHTELGVQEVSECVSEDINRLITVFKRRCKDSILFLEENKREQLATRLRSCRNCSWCGENWWIEERELLLNRNKELDGCKKTRVTQITFDVEYKGKLYKSLNMGITANDEISEDYIHDEDGPWGMVEFGKEMFDVQIYDVGEGLQMQAVRMKEIEKVKKGEVKAFYTYAGDVEKNEIKFVNIKVEIA